MRTMNSQIKKNNRDFRRDDDGLVDVLFPVEQLEHESDAARVDGPDVSARATVDHDIDEDGGRNDTKPCDQNHHVVPADAGALDEPTCQESDYENDSRDDEQGGTDSLIQRSGVSHRSLAGFLLPSLGYFGW
jgi:hypothetical protein